MIKNQIVVLERLVEGEDKSPHPLRDTRLVCIVIQPPVVGQRAVFIAEARDTTHGENARMITTSEVKMVDDSYGDTIYFETETGSRYAIGVE